MSRYYPKLSQRHIGVMIWLLEHPTSTITDCAKATGYSRSWLSRIVNSPEFKSALNKQLDWNLKNILSLRSLEHTKRNFN